jgi:hypothetical protein
MFFNLGPVFRSMPFNKSSPFFDLLEQRSANCVPRQNLKSDIAKKFNFFNNFLLILSYKIIW